MSILIVFISACKNDTPQVNMDAKSSTYNEKRIAAINADLNMSVGMEMSKELNVLGIVMDWNLGKGNYVTVTGRSNGMASLFTSDSNKDISFKHQNIANVMERVLEASFDRYPSMKKFTNTNLPEEHHVRFYFQTNQGITMADGFVPEISDVKSYWGPLFRDMNELISEIRSTGYDLADQKVE